MAYSRYATEMKDGDNNIYGLMDEEARAQLSDLNSAINTMAGENQYAALSSVSGYTSEGMTFNKVSNGLSISGTCAGGNKYYEGLNGSKSVKYTSSTPTKILAPGSYVARLKVISNAPDKELTLIVSNTTYGTTYGNSYTYFKDGDIFTVTEDTAIALRIIGETQFGTAQSPTVIYFGVDSVVSESTIPIKDGSTLALKYSGKSLGITENCASLIGTNNFSDTPSGHAGQMMSVKYAKGYSMKFFFDSDDDTMSWARGNASNGVWHKLHAYDLYPTGDDTDRTDEIVSCISRKKFVAFAPGEYYIRTTVINGGVLKGAGMHATKLIYKNLNPGVDTYNALRLRPYSSISDLTLEAYLDDPENYTPVEDYSAGSNGIRIEGTGSTGTGPYHCTVENVMIKNFSGCGIKQRRTGYYPWDGCSFRNIHVIKCSAGIYLGEYAEFCTVIGCYMTECYHGIVIMGGNNVVDSCIISENEININMPDTDGYGSSANDAHGLISSCRLNHAGYYSNTKGYGIKRGAQSSGELIVGCMFGEGVIEVKDSGNGMQFSGCAFRNGIGGIISDNSLIIMLGCEYQSIGEVPTSVINGGRIFRRNCFTYNGIELDDVT